MSKKTNLSLTSCLMLGIFITGCSQQPANLSAPSARLADVQPAPTITPSTIDSQLQDAVVPKAPAKPYYKPRPKMVKPVQRMHKPIQRMHKPVQRPRMLKPVRRMMSKPIQRHYGS